MKKICIYPGRFQPFCPHHAKIYQYLVKMFGASNTYIVTSNKIDSLNQLSFDEKRRVMLQYGIPDTNIIQVKSPYKPIELLQFFDAQSTVAVFALGEKDSSRLRGEYFKEYITDDDSLCPYSANGYVMIVPNIRNQSRISSASEFRQSVDTLTPSSFKAYFGWYDDAIYSMMKTHFGIAENSNTNAVKFKTSGRHIFHPYEDRSMTMIELVKCLSYAFDGKTDLYEKFDGQNIKLTWHNGQICAARNKTTVKTPMTATDVKEKFKNRGPLSYIFSDAVLQINHWVQENRDLIGIFNGRFLNLEICHPDNRNVIDYGAEPFLVFHNLILFDADGNDINSYTFTASERKLLHDKLNGFSKYGPYKYFRLPHLISPAKSTLSAQFANDIMQYCNKFGKSYTDSIDNLSVDEFQALKKLVLQYGDWFIKLIYGPHQNHRIDNDFQLIANTISTMSDELKSKYTANLQYDLLSPNPIEGIVYTFNGNMYKLVGSFAPINQILGIYRYGR